MKAPAKKKYEKGGEAKITPFEFPKTVCLTEKELPEIKDWKVGEKYTITLEVEQTSMRKSDMGGEMKAEFKILKAMTEDQEEAEEMEEESGEYAKGGKVKKKKSSGETSKKDPNKKYIGQYDMQ